MCRRLDLESPGRPKPRFCKIPCRISTCSLAAFVGETAALVRRGGGLDCPGGNFLLYNRNPYRKDGFGAARIGLAVLPSPRIVALPEFSK
jgi:hypothetical protein